MKSRAVVLCTLAVALALVLTWVVVADEQELGPSVIDTETADDGPTLNVNLGTDPSTLDPALASDASSVNVIEQLFVGLVDLDDKTLEVKPELASSWTASPDATVYTFTLRSDVFWSDGNPITAEDVRYGILRTLDPDTGSNYAYVLYIIENARDYNAGTISDPGQVGVTALDATTLRITFEQPTGYALSILSTWVARPMPRQAIEAHGVPTWTEPTNIVTSGPYQLTEWLHDDHILLTKSPTYYGADNVQIEQVRMEMVVDATTAFQMYQNGELDTSGAPLSEMLNIRSDPLLSQELVVVPGACTYYYGFTNNKPPFDDPLVRRAFSAAIDRVSLIRNLTRGGQLPANSFAPGSIFGNTAQDPDVAPWALDPALGKAKAREWLAEAGYPGGQGFPTVTLMHNTSEGHRAIAEAIESMWESTLGVQVEVEDREWGTYLDIIEKTTPLAEMPHVWHMGWCADYADQNNWVHEVFNCEEGANRCRRNCVDETCSACEPSEFDELTQQAGRIADQEQRKALYRQAEKILSEEEAAYAPIYHYTSQVLTKPYLERTYGMGANLGHIADWRITRTSAVIGTDGGDLSSDDGGTTVQVPQGAFTDTVVMTHTPATGMPPGGSLNGIGNVFDLTAVYSDTGQVAEIAPGYTYSVTAEYSDSDLGPTIEDTLALYWWDEGAGVWTQEGISSTVDTTENTVRAEANHFSVFAVLGETNRIYLPLVLRGG